jgi:hypothetical protein
VASLVTAAFLSGLVVPATVFAQDPTQPIASPDDEQLALNDEAVRAIIDGD